MVKPIPDRWLNYQPIGERIAGTRFIAFKVPLNQHINESVDEGLRLAPHSLLESVPNLGLIVDLTNTNRYYNPQTFQKENVEHQKLKIPGHQTPSRALAQKFCQYVTNFLEANSDNDKLIGVHCTHGVNRTGYLICYFMITEMNMSPKLAIQTFADARGHKIERENYTRSLLQLLEHAEHPECSPSTREIADDNEPKDWRRQCGGGGTERRVLDNTEQGQRYERERYNGQSYGRERYNGQRYEGQRYNGRRYEEPQRGENWRQEPTESWQRQRSYATRRRYDDHQDEGRYGKRQRRNDNEYAWQEEETGRRTRRPQPSWRSDQPETERGYSSSSRNHSSNTRFIKFRENNNDYRSRNNYSSNSSSSNNNGNRFGNKANKYESANNNNSTNGSRSTRHKFFNDQD